MAIKRIISNNFPFIPIVVTVRKRVEKVKALVVTLGNEVMIGRGITDKFKIIFDHGRKVIIEP